MPAPARRTQEERSAATQRALLDAAVECLVEQGWQGLSTTAVADRAGVSRGAQLHHYPTRADLVAAAVAHVFEGLTSDYEKAFAALDQSERSAARAVALLKAVCLDPRHHAVLDLYTAARTDPELRASVVPVAARHRENVVALACRYFPEAAGDEGFRLTLDLLVHAVVGMALAHGLYGEDPAAPALERLMERLATDAADGAARAWAPGEDGARRVAAGPRVAAKKVDTASARKPEASAHGRGATGSARRKTRP